MIDLFNSDVPKEAQLTDLMPELLTDKNLWNVFLQELLEPSMSDLVVDPANQVTLMRWLLEKKPVDGGGYENVPTTDTDLLIAAAGMLGFNLSFDLLKSVKVKFLSHVFQLPLYYQSNGPGFRAITVDENGIVCSHSFINFLEYILGTKITYKELWSNSTHSNSYDRLLTSIPNGGLERTEATGINSNTWFRTTHINLDIDVTRIPTAFTEAVREGRTYDQKLKELFYAYAPITLVINDIKYSYYTYGRVWFKAISFDLPLLTYRITGSAQLPKTIASVVIDGPSVVLALNSAVYCLQVTYSNGDVEQVNADAWISESSYLIVNRYGFCTTLPVSDTIFAVLTARLGTHAYQKRITLVKSSGDPVVAVTVQGSDVIAPDVQAFRENRPRFHEYTLLVTTASGSEYTATGNSVVWTVPGFSSQNGSLVQQSGKLTITVASMPYDCYFNVNAVFTDGFGLVHVATKTVKFVGFEATDIVVLDVRSVVTSNGTVNRDADPITDLVTGHDYSYSAWAINYAGDRFEVTALWLALNSSLPLTSTGIVTVPPTLAFAYPTELVASYSYGLKNISTKLAITVNPVQITPLYVTLEGYGLNPGEYLAENKGYLFQARVHWSDNSSTISPARWVSTVFSINSDTGLLNTGLVSDDTVIDLYAQVVFEGLSGIDSWVNFNPFPPQGSFPCLSTRSQVTLRPHRLGVHVTGVTLTGTSVLTLPQTAKLYSYTVNSDAVLSSATCLWQAKDANTRQDLTGSVIGITVDHDLAVVSVMGDAQANALQYPRVEITATYTLPDGSTVSANHVLYLIIGDSSKTPVGCELLGPSQVSAHSRQQYQAVLLFSDHSTQPVTAQWEVTCDPVYLTDQPDYLPAWVTPDGLLTTRTVHGDTVVVVKARHYLCRMEKIVVIKDDYNEFVDQASCFFIEGPMSICVGEQAGYSFNVYWNDDPNPSRESAVWTITQPENALRYVALSADGTLTPVTTSTAPASTDNSGTPYLDIVITAVYSCGLKTPISKSYPVRVLWCKNDGDERHTPAPKIYTPCTDQQGSLISIDIYGPAVVDELTHTPYLLMGYFAKDNDPSQGFSEVLTADFWELSGALDYRYGEVSTTGVLNALDVFRDQRVTLYACYTDGLSHQTLCASKPVLIKDKISVVSESIAIAGALTMFDASMEVFTVFLTLTDGTVTQLTTGITWEIISGTSLLPLPGYITTPNTPAKLDVIAGTLAQGMSNFTVVMRASYNAADIGRTLTDEHTVVISHPNAVLRTVWGYGPWGGLDDAFVSARITTPFPEVSGQTFTISANRTEYVYFCHPVSLGTATFQFTDMSGMVMQGGMDGVSWPENQIGDVYGPVTIQRSGTSWYLYRSDFINQGNFTVKVFFSKA